MEKFVQEVQNCLEKTIIPFWLGLKDEANGGYYGYVDHSLTVDKTYEKGCILNSRILWFFSQAYILLKDQKLYRAAAHAYDFLRSRFVDPAHGGVYWSVSWDGAPKDESKHTYSQAFAIYALSSWHDASGDESALSLARELQGIIEEKCADDGGYLESFDREFRPVDNDKLSENGVLAQRTMNTLLHIFEAYTELYRVSPNKRTKGRLKFMLDLMADKIYNRTLGRQEVFFDKDWNSLLDLYSYGHDIEAAWLIDRGLAVLADDAYAKKLSPITEEITENIYRRALDGGSLLNEAENGAPDTTRVWWVQAEAVVGFLNGYQKNPQRTHYLEAAKSVWRYIQTYLIDKRDGSEWFWAVDAQGRPLPKPMAEPWKCPYHNGRMCMEIIRRFGE